MPTLIWTKNQPEDYEKYAVNENNILLASAILYRCFIEGENVQLVSEETVYSCGSILYRMQKNSGLEDWQG